MQILLVFTGGTIGSTIDDNTVNVDSSMTCKLIKMYKEQYGDDVSFEIQQPINILSENLNISHWRILYDCIDTALEKGFYDGIVITHGSDTLAYTASFLGFCFRHTDIPIIITASNYPVEDERSNGFYNFSNSINLIKSQTKSGVFVVYQNNRYENIVYISTHLQEATRYNDQFSSYDEIGYGQMYRGKLIRNNKPIIPPKSYSKIRVDSDFKNEVIMLHPYPNFNYSIINLNSSIKAILVCLYHSSTASTIGENTSLVKFIEKCSALGITVYLCSFKKEEKNLYATSSILLETDAIPLYSISKESAYVKLLVAYNQSSMPSEEFMQTNIYYEYV